MAPDHWAAEVPHGADHSSPASFQSYFINARVRTRTNTVMMLELKIVAGGGIEPPTRNINLRNRYFSRDVDIKNIVDLSNSL
jgi:hypothetical protein